MIYALVPPSHEIILSIPDMHLLLGYPHHNANANR